MAAATDSPRHFHSKFTPKRAESLRSIVDSEEHDTRFFDAVEILLYFGDSDKEILIS